MDVDENVTKNCNIDNGTEVTDVCNEVLRTEEVPKRPVYESVHATAEITNSKKSITDVEINALNCIFFKSKEHLVRNIKGIESGVCQTVRNHEDGYRHLLPLIFSVDTTNLWENSRSYIFHHLGRDTWTKDGTEIRLIRIHRK